MPAIRIEESDAVQNPMTRLIDAHADCLGRIAELEAALDRAAGVIGQMHKTILHLQGTEATQPNGEEVLARAALSKST